MLILSVSFIIMEWYERARALMKQQGITQDDLIPVFCVKTRGAVGHYLTGRRQPDHKQLMALARRLGISLEELLTGEAKKPAATTQGESNINHPAGIDNLLQKLKNSASPRTLTLIERLAVAAAENRLTESDLELLEQIAARLMDKPHGKT